MQRRSKEPRRISVVEGRVAATLPRALTIVSVRIYKNETTNSGTSQYLPEHLFSNLVYKARTRVALPRARGGAAGATANAAVEQCARERLRPPPPALPNRSPKPKKSPRMSPKSAKASGL